jgi:beta-lactamase class A
VRAKYYKIGQAPPVRHWYQKRVGWFGKLCVSVFVMSVIGAGAMEYTIVQNDTRALAAQTSKSNKLKKVTSAPLEQTDAQNIIDIQTVIDHWVAEHPAQKWGVVAKSINGPTFDAKINADKEFESASIYKLFLVMPLFNQIAVEHQKNIKVNIGGGQKPIATCVDLMLRLSNNECGEAIGNYLNWSKADKMLKTNGFTHTTFKETNKLRTSAGDTASFLEQLNGDMLNRTAKDTVMRSLREQRWRSGIPTGCPGCIVANKTGDIDNVTHDAAIVQYKGGSYVLVIFSEGGNFKQISELTGQIQQKILDTTK